jgi:Mu transposase-like protein
VGRHLTIKADASSLTIYDQQQEIVSYARCWQRGRVLALNAFKKNCSNSGPQPSDPRHNSA